MPPVQIKLALTDRAQSVIHSTPGAGRKNVAYTPFGYHAGDAQRATPAFDGQFREMLTLFYILGDGYRAFDTVHLRFVSPDSMSPFGAGGVNAYAYCAGDPINKVDPDRHFWRRLRSWLGRRTSPRATTPSQPSGFRNPLARPRSESISTASDNLSLQLSMFETRNSFSSSTGSTRSQSSARNPLASPLGAFSMDDIYSDANAFVPFSRNDALKIMPNNVLPPAYDFGTRPDKFSRRAPRAGKKLPPAFESSWPWPTQLPITERRGPQRRALSLDSQSIRTVMPT